ncbi:MAG: PEGA domain-containing protein [Spirochaetales bacterium]|nr:PEGA domain-containing protein [Spirochaetales bacterium]
MKRYLFVLFLSTVSFFLFPGGIPVAIMDMEPIGILPDKALTVSELLRVEFIKLPVFKVVERKDLLHVLGEQELQLSGLTNAGDAVKFGRMLNVKKILLGSLAKFEGKFVQYVLNIRMVDVETGSVEIAESMDIANDDEIRKTCHAIAGKVAGTISIVGEVVLIEGDDVYINLGIDVGLREGDHLEVFDVELVKDKRGNILLREEKDVAYLKISSVDREASRCTAVRRVKEIANGMVVRKSTNQLEPENGRAASITFTSIPEGAKAYINGEFVGITPVTMEDFKPGIYSAEMRYPGHRSYAGKIRLTEGRQITVERELEKIVEVEDMLEGGKIPRKTTDPGEALTWALIPGGGQFYNKYETTGLGISAMTFMGLAGGGLFLYNYLNEVDTRDAGEYDEFYKYVLDYKISGNLLDCGIIAGTALAVYLVSILESAQSASSPFKYYEYTEIKFGGLGVYTNSSQYPNTFTGSGPEVYANPVLDEKTADMSGTDLGAFISAGIRSRYFDMSFEFGFSTELSLMGLAGRLKLPVFTPVTVSAGIAYISNMNDTREVEYTEEDPVAFLRSMVAPVVGLSFEMPSFLFIFEGTPFAFGAADFFYTTDPGESWTKALYLQSLLGMYLYGRLDYYFSTRIGVSIEARYISFYGMLDTEAKDAGIPVFQYHDTIFITIGSIFRF